MNETPAPKLRKRPWLSRGLLALMLLVLGGGMTWVGGFSSVQRQDKYLRTVMILFAAFILFLLWVLFASGWRARRRWSVFVGVAAIVLLCRFTLRISGVTGDLIPIVEWKWKQPAIVSVESTSASAPRSPSNEAVPLTNSYPQFLGPNRDGTLPGPQLARDWKKNPPKELWRHPVGAAWSGFAVAGSFAITQEQRGEEELVVCYDLLTGKVIWSHSDQSRYATTIAGEGPRATPTISSNRVYTMGGSGILNCLELATGTVVWTKDTIREHKAAVPMWGAACSPLVTERAVVVTVGGAGHTLVAYDKATGIKLWASGNDSVHWSSPERVAIAGVPQILIFHENVASHDEQTGKLLWQHPWRSSQPRVTVPLVLSGDRVLVSQGYGGGSELLQITRENSRWRATRIWKSIRMKSKFANLIHLDGYIYGLDDGALACIDLATGDLKWKGERYGHGQMIFVGTLLLLTAENGDVVLIEPVPNEPRELSRFPVLKAKTWNPPALAGDLLLVRNHEEAACLRLAIEPVR